MTPPPSPTPPPARRRTTTPGWLFDVWEDFLKSHGIDPYSSWETRGDPLGFILRLPCGVDWTARDESDALRLRVMTKPDIGKDHKVDMTSCWKDEHVFWLPSFISLRGRPGTLHLVVDIEIYKEGEEDGEERDFPPWMFQEEDGKERYLYFPPLF